jgi:glyoxylase-like metal-dependent hydrolase (beta-lactamase superfamily II)
LGGTFETDSKPPLYGVVFGGCICRAAACCGSGKDVMEEDCERQQAAALRELGGHMANEVLQLNLGMVNSYLIKGSDGFILVDTGISMNRAALDEQLDKSGCTPGKLKLIVLTHGDIDHIGSAAYLGKKFGVKIAMDKNDAPMAIEGQTLARKQRTLIGKIRSYIFSATGIMKKMAASLEKFTPDIYPEDGYSLMPYGVDAKIVSIPGHTPGSIGVITAGGDFISGDTINNRKKPAIGEMVYSDEVLKKSVEKMKALNIKKIYPGHGTPFIAGELLKVV